MIDPRQVFARVQNCESEMTDREVRFARDIAQRADCTAGQRRQLAASVREICEHVKRCDQLFRDNEMTAALLLSELLPIATRELTAVELGQPDPQAANNHLRIPIDVLVSDVDELSTIVWKIGTRLSRGALVVEKVIRKDDIALQLALDSLFWMVPFSFAATSRNMCGK
jgi:hypothetical protein